MLTVQYGDSEQYNPEDVYAHIAVIAAPEYLDGITTYPDYLRYVPIDNMGNSPARRFLFDVPTVLRGKVGHIQIVEFSTAGHVVSAASIPSTIT